MRRRTSNARSIRSAAWVAVWTLWLVSNGRAADLTVTDLILPGTIYAGTGSLVYVEVDNLGATLDGDYALDVVLSIDESIDAGDPIIGSSRNNTLGWQTILVNTAVGLAPGAYHVGARIDPVRGETVVGNNSLVGGTVDVLQVMIGVDDADPILFQAHASDAMTASATTTVTNIGSPGSVLVFAVAPVEPTPWLQVTPESGFALAPTDSVSIEISAVPLGVSPGTHDVTLRFQNWMIADDYVDVTVTLSIDDPKISAGDRLIGDIATSGEEDVAVVDVVKGEVFKLKTRSKKGDLKPRVDVISPDGDVEASLSWKHSPDFVKKTHKFKKSGQYALKIYGKKATSGSYEIKTGCKLPKLAKKREVVLKGPEGPSPAEVKVLMLPGALLSFTVTTNAAFAGPLSLSYITPSGTQVDIQPAVVISDDVTIEGIEAEEVGEYRILVSGFGSDPGAKATVLVDPTQPEKSSGDIVVP